MGKFNPINPTVPASTAIVPWWLDQHLNLTPDSTLGCIPDHQVFLNLKDKAEQAIAYFEADFRLPGILIENHQQVIGVLSRQRFYELMSRPFSLELFTQRPLVALWKFLPQNALVLEAEMSITRAACQALQRPASDIYEPIMVKRAANQYGIVEVHSLLLAQSTIHEWTLEELQASKQALAAERDLAQTTLQAIADGVITTDRRGVVRDLNQVAEMLTGCDRATALARPVTEIFQPLEEGSQTPLTHPVQLVLDTGQPVYSQRNALLENQDTSLDIQYSASPIMSDAQELLGAVLVFRDVTHQQALLRKIHWQACHDALTGLMNRIEFENQLSTSIHEAAQVAPELQHMLLYIDLDRFKVVNDTCGHFAGDELLKQVSDLLTSCLRQGDYLARLGGDEFGILLTDCDSEEGQAIADRIFQAIQNFRFIWQEYVFTIGVSVGFTVVNGTASATEVLKQADGACYLAKHQGRNQICAYHPVNDEVSCPQPTQLVNQISQALTHSRFSLFHQNIYAQTSPSSTQLFASEILIRLPNGHGGWIRPDAFLSTAERYRLMTEIDRWVVQSFCQSYQAIRAYLHPEIFSINLSGASLNSDRLLTFIQTQLATHKIPPQSICFEVTETIAIANLTQARLLLQQLKALGCRLALDDFGSGMSSFHYLRTLPVDYLKIDGSLIRDVASDRVAQEMVAAVIKIGHEMGLKTIAEWVETDDVMAILTALGNDYLQGFALHAPENLPFTPTHPPQTGYTYALKQPYRSLRQDLARD